MTDTRIYFGRPGALAALRSPRGTLEATRTRRVASFDLGLGGVSVDQMVGGARTYTINYDQLFREDFATLQAFLDGHEGPGPFALLDPGQRNMLPANICGATSVTNSLDGGPTGGFGVYAVLDEFNRSAVSSGYGTAETGQAWALSGGSSAEYNTVVGSATMSHTSTGVIRSAVVDTGATDFDFYADVSFNVGTPTGNSITHWLFGRYLNGSNYYQAQLVVSTAGVSTIQLGKRVGGTGSNLGTAYTLPGTHASGDIWRVHFQGIQGGGTCALKINAWQPSVSDEPSTWQVSLTDTSLTTGTSIGIAGRLEGGNTNTLPVTSTWYRVVVASQAAGSSSATYTDAGPRTLALTFGAVGNAVIVPTWPSSTFTAGIPVVGGRAICMSCWVRGGGADAITTWTPTLVWRDSAGSLLSTTTTGSGAVTSSAGAWTQMYATGTPPAGAVYADFIIPYTSGASVGSIAYFRRFMVNEGSTPDTTWVPGTGVWPVRFLSMPEAWPFLSPELRTSPTAVLVEDVS